MSHWSLWIISIFIFRYCSAAAASCSAAEPKLESISKPHCGTPLSSTWFVRGIYHTNSPEVISIFTRQSVLHTSHLENSWLLPIIHKWRLTFRLGRGHIHYVEKYHLLMKQWRSHPPDPPPPSTLPMHIEQHPGPIANERAPADMMYTVHQYGPDVF